MFGDVFGEADKHGIRVCSRDVENLDFFKIRQMLKSDLLKI